VGLKGAALSANPEEVSTTGTTDGSDEERSDSRELRVRGLSGWLRSREQQSLAGLSGCSHPNSRPQIRL